MIITFIKCRKIKNAETDKSYCLSYTGNDLYFYSKKYCSITPVVNLGDVFFIDIPDWMYDKMDWKQKLDIDLIHREGEKYNLKNKVGNEI